MARGDGQVAALVRAATNDRAAADDVIVAMHALLALDPAVGRAVVFDLLAGEPRLKPSRGLIIDPDDACRARWSRRVAAAAALVSSPDAGPALDELLDELSDDPQLAADVRAAVEARSGPDGVGGFDVRRERNR